MSLLTSCIWWSRRRDDLHPAAWTPFDIWIVALGTGAIVPVILFLLLWLRRGRFLFIYRGRLNNDRRRPIVWMIVWIVWSIPRPVPPWSDPYAPSEKESAMRISRQGVCKNERHYSKNKKKGLFKYPLFFLHDISPSITLDTLLLLPRLWLYKFL